MTKHTFSALGLVFICAIAFQGAAFAVEKKPVDIARPKATTFSYMTVVECVQMQGETVLDSSCKSGVGCKPKVVSVPMVSLPCITAVK
jgi:hypothetical protein